ncbi:hypothetical protein PUMCH_002902 [Australozyma saopauloensis]|uniref:non-specific serine/threonine protein kinase n=1 Tax=Australozyma saopauloensis TaxID=291208 RepID=A0AAX4HB68_9ASCO|nr:hypothetical protein PUMCH_002902 [[Candida] saopauloensis]
MSVAQIQTSPRMPSPGATMVLPGMADHVPRQMDRSTIDASAVQNRAVALKSVHEKSYIESEDHRSRSDASALNSRNSLSGSSRKAHREVRFGAYVLGLTLGEGEFGKVKLGWRKDGQHPSQVAIKLIKRDTLARDTELEVKIHREINSMRLLSHPNIINLVEVLKSGKYIGIVLEYASGGELFEHILQHKHLKENVAKRLFAQLVSGVDYMHLKGLIHRDLKLENLLLDKHKNIIISDFGFVNSYNRAKNDLMKTSCGLPCYAAPELVLTRTPYSGRKVDIWSMGVILYAMLAGYLPFDDDIENEDGSDIVRLYNYICSTRLTFPEYVSPLARDLLRRIIVPDPARRIGIDEIRNHPWLALHASLLAIRQPEWDRIAHDEKLSGSKIASAATAAQVGQNRNKRFSMISETTNSSALMLSGSKPAYGKSYASSSNIIYSNPTTSSSFANVVATSTDSENRSQRASSVSTQAEISANATAATLPMLLPHQKGHAKSASISNSHSSASNALKAMVSDQTAISEQEKPVESDPVSLPVTPLHLSRNSTYAGTIPTIAESPTAAQFEPTATRALPAPIERLPHTQKRPRPTSYHPGSMSLSFIMYNNSASTVLDIFKSQAHSPSHPYSHFLLSSPTRTPHGVDSAVSIGDNGNGSPVLLAAGTTRRTTRRDSVVTAINVNGVLSSEISNHDNERNSVLSYLEDKMDALELTELHSPTRVPLDDSDLPVIRNIPQIPKLQTTLPQPGKATPIIDQLPKFAVAAESPVITQSDSLLLAKPDEQRLDPEATPKLGHSPNEASNAIEQGVAHTTPNVETLVDETPDVAKKATVLASEAQSVPVPVERPQTDSKEVQENKKKNRFSILSFYGSSSFSSYNLSEGQEENNKDKVEGANVGSRERRRVESAGSSNSQRRPMSMISQNTTNTHVTAKEASAARKVMNFFKRRSVRIG